MNPRPITPLAVPVILATLALGGFSSAHASLIVYEGFDYGPLSSLLGGLGNTTEIGLQGAWTSNGTGQTTVEYIASGLTFSDLSVTGGLAQLNGVIPVAGDRTAAAFRQLNVPDQSGTLWGSYLFRKNSDAVPRSVAALLQGNVANMTDNTAYFSLANNEFNQTVGGVRVSALVGGNMALANGEIPLLGTTYLFVFKLENIGAPSGSTQTASAWMLSEAQYDNFKLDGLDESELNGATLGSLATDVMERVSLTTTSGLASPGTFDASDFIRFFNFSGGELITQFDEVKFSNASLNEAVVGIPEPSAVLAMLGGMGMLIGIQRSRPKR
jgi:hypothetical protein